MHIVEENAHRRGNVGLNAEPSEYLKSITYSPIHSIPYSSIQSPGENHAKHAPEIFAAEEQTQLKLAA